VCVCGPPSKLITGWSASVRAYNNCMNYRSHSINLACHHRAVRGPVLPRNFGREGGGTAPPVAGIALVLSVETAWYWWH